MKDEVIMFHGKVLDSFLIADDFDWPDIPGLKIALAEVEKQEANNSTSEANQPGSQNGTDEPNSTDSFTDKSVDQNQNTISTVQENFLRDKSGNTLAVLTLIGMIAVIIIIAIYYISGKPSKIFNLPSWIIPVTSIIGIFIAFYLSYIEMTESIAVCGPVGDCNTVQQSSYASLFGIIPIGILGIVGYIAILITWFIYHFKYQEKQKALAYLIWGMSWFGVLFSIYLTFLEPFVIGATCMWCISSAIAMTIILWTSTSPIMTYISEQDDVLLSAEE